jgi:multiple sugar transport system substrate-binding protein
MVDYPVPPRRVSRRGFLASSAWAGLGVTGGSLLAACTGSPENQGTITPPSTEPVQVRVAGGTVTWGAWANSGEAETFKRFTVDYAAKTGASTSFRQFEPGAGYLPTLLKLLADGTAPDLFYSADSELGAIIQAGGARPLDDYLSSEDASVKLSDTYVGLRRWCTGPDGKTYAVVVDCNPMVLWFNKLMLSEAGITRDPATAFAAGNWNLDAMTDLLTAVKKSGKAGGVVESEWNNWWGYITAVGGTMVDDAGKAVFDTDAKAMVAIEWLLEQLRSGNLLFTGTLPKGETPTAWFYGAKLATIPAGRWNLPTLRKLRSTVAYDIAPLPSEDGGTIAPVPVATAAMAVNAKAKDVAAALNFLGKFTNADGQRFRLSGAGNAVPSQPGMDEIVTEGNDPAHAGWLTDVALKGYAIPTCVHATPNRPRELREALTAMLMPDGLASTTPATFATRLVSLLNR